MTRIGKYWYWSSVADFLSSSCVPSTGHMVNNRDQLNREQFYKRVKEPQTPAAWMQAGWRLTHLETSASPHWTLSTTTRRPECTPYCGWAGRSPASGCGGWWWPSPGTPSNERTTGSTCTCREPPCSPSYNKCQIFKSHGFHIKTMWQNI